MIIDSSQFKCKRKGKFSEHYNKLEPIGRGIFIYLNNYLGSYGSVYKAIHIITKHIRSIKVTAKKLINSCIEPEAELEILGKLDHPNIIHFYEYFQDDNNYYLITEYIYIYFLIDIVMGGNYLN